MSDTLPFACEHPERLKAQAHRKRAESHLLFAEAAEARLERANRTVAVLDNLTSAEIAKTLKISKATLSRFVRDGMPVSFAGARRRFDLVAAKNWLAARGPKAAPKPMSTRLVNPEVEVRDYDLGIRGFRRVG